MAERSVALVLAGSTGGIGTHVRSLAEGLVQAGDAVTVIGPAGTEQTFGFSRTGARFVPLELGSGLAADLAAARRLRDLLTADIVHAHGLRAALAAGTALGPRRPGRHPLVATWHNALIETGAAALLWRAAARRAARRADVTLGASADLVAAALAYGAADARLGPVAAPALPPARRSAADVRSELAAGDRPLVVAVGRLHKQKGFDTLVRASAGWPSPTPLVVVAGEGPERPALESLIAAQAAPVRLLGRRDDVADLLRAADLAVISSVWEARALVAQEALALGTPLVATAVGGLPGLVGDAAILVPAGDEAALRVAMTQVIGNPERAQALRESGRARALSWPDESEVVRLIRDVYDELQVPS